MKKTIIIILIVLLMIALSGCGRNTVLLAENTKVNKTHIIDISSSERTNVTWDISDAEATVISFHVYGGIRQIFTNGEVT
jgi:peptidoglycan hydrolase CwlO-like protein